MKSTAVTLNMLAVPALAAVAGLHHPGAIASPAASTVATPTVATLTAAIDSSEATCQAWEPVLPGLLYLATTPVLTLGGVPLIGAGTCEPTGKGYDISLGVNLAIPPGSACTTLPLIKVNLGLAIGVPDENGVDPCQAPAAPAPVAPVAPAPVPPAPVPPAPAVAPRPAAPSAPALAPPPPPAPRPPARRSAPALAPPPPAQSSPALASPPPRRPAPPPATTPAPSPTTTTSAAVLPPPPVPRPPAPRPPAPPAPAPPVQAAAAVAPATVKHAHKPVPRKQAPRPARTFFQAAPEQPPAPAFKPGQPVLPVAVLVTVVMTPCVATVAARLGKIMMGHAA